MEKKPKKKRSDFLNYYITLQTALERSLDNKPIIDKDLNENQAYSSSQMMTSGMSTAFHATYAHTPMRQSILTSYQPQMSGQPVPSPPLFPKNRKVSDEPFYTMGESVRMLASSIREFAKKTKKAFGS